VGGIKEKVLAAHRAGIRTIILPERNEKDTLDIPDDVRDELELVFVTTLEEALEVALGDPPSKPDTTTPPVTPPPGGPGTSGEHPSLLCK
jgi:ATP-dependent Lon protease